MSFTNKKRDGKEYVYFQAGAGQKRTYYLHPKDNDSKVNVENVRKAIQYMKKRIDDDQEILDRLNYLLNKTTSRQK